ncbi:MAG: DNA topoisomerase 3 [Candidatus Poseidoniaceae archaeon]|nr:MAG: DNA topoisomerase 3 [Candidatus Poseidoniaceae archaeon]
MSIVVLAEKPSVAEDIAKMLNINKKETTHWSGNDIVVTWAVGHMLELKYMDDYNPEFKNWRKTASDLPFVPDEFEFKPKSGSTRKQLTAVKKLMSDKAVTEIVNACDAAREGELIFQTIYQHSKSKSPVSRMWLQSMTTEAIQRAWDERKSASEYQNLADAAYSRSYADWLIGMNGSRIAEVFLPKKRTERISLGRVQTATLAILVDHEIEILKHIPTPFWTLSAQFEGSGSSWNGRWEGGAATEDTKPHWILTHEDKERIQALIDSGEQATVTQKVTTSKERPPLNFDLTTLQRQANSMFSWPAKRTLNVAQALYERHKLTTYPRTDSRFLPTDMKETIDTTLSNLGKLDEMSGFIDKLTKNGMQNVARNFNDAKVSDHFAIIPTGKLPTSALSKDEQRLYNMIVRNFIASWYAEAVIEKQKRTANLAGEIFNKEAQQYTTLGWREVVAKNLSHPKGWGTFSKESPLASVSSHEWSEEKSKPPTRIKEARLLSLMEKAGKDIEDEDLAEAMAGKGLGTPATRADTIEKLLSRGYISRQQSGALNATPHGIRIIEILRRIPVEWITSAELTGEMESALTAVQRGELEASKYMENIVEQTTDLVTRVRDHDRSQLFVQDEPIGNCPQCMSEIIETALSYTCEKNEGKEKGCSFVFWKDTSGRWFDRSTAKRLLEQKELTDLHGFFNRNGEAYETSVVISNEGKVTSSKSTGNRANSSDEAICPCPKCDGTIRETDTHYACDQETCKFSGVGKIICKREINRDEAKSILVEGKSPLIEDFISRRGRPFPAYLVLEGNKVGFEFPPREAAADARRFEVTPGVVAVCPKHGAEIYETETHFRPKTSASGCKIDIPREISKREITREEAKILIEKGEIGPFDDLIAKKSGNPYTAILWLKKNERVGYRFAKR